MGAPAEVAARARRERVPWGPRQQRALEAYVGSLLSHDHALDDDEDTDGGGDGGGDDLDELMARIHAQESVLSDTDAALPKLAETDDDENTTTSAGGSAVAGGGGGVGGGGGGGGGGSGGGCMLCEESFASAEESAVGCGACLSATMARCRWASQRRRVASLCGTSPLRGQSPSRTRVASSVDRPKVPRWVERLAGGAADAKRRELGAGPIAHTASREPSREMVPGPLPVLAGMAQTSHAQLHARAPRGGAEVRRVAARPLGCARWAASQLLDVEAAFVALRVMLEVESEQEGYVPSASTACCVPA